MLELGSGGIDMALGKKLKFFDTEAAAAAAIELKQI
jgi:hypothetical protein